MAPFPFARDFRELGTEYPASTKYKDGRACGSCFGSNRHFITFMVEPHYSVYYIYGQILLHLCLKVFTFMVSFIFMVNFYYIYGWYYIYGFTTFMGDTNTTL